MVNGLLSENHPFNQPATAIIRYNNYNILGVYPLLIKHDKLENELYMEFLKNKTSNGWCSFPQLLGGAPVYFNLDPETGSKPCNPLGLT